MLTGRRYSRRIFTQIRVLNGTLFGQLTEHNATRPRTERQSQAERPKCLATKDKDIAPLKMKIREPESKFAEAIAWRPIRDEAKAESIYNAVIDSLSRAGIRCHLDAHPMQLAKLHALIPPMQRHPNITKPSDTFLKTKTIPHSLTHAFTTKT